MLRSILLLALLSGLAWWFHGEQSRGQFRAVDEGFLDFLLANSREELKPEAATSKNVVLVQVREEDKKEFSAWPPQPIDYQMMVKGLKQFEPAVLVIATPLQWPEPKPEFISQLAQSLLPFPRVVLAATASIKNKVDTATITLAKEKVPAVAQWKDESRVLPTLTGLAAQPEPALIRESDLGLVMTDKKPVAIHADTVLLSSMELLTMANATHTPLTFIRLGTGPGAGVHLGDELFVPAMADGTWSKSTIEVPAVNALDLMTNGLTDQDPEVTQKLGKGKVVVLGLDSGSSPSSALRQSAAIIANSLALPRIRVLPFLEQIAAWAVAAVLGLSLLRLPKTKALTRTVLFLFVALLASYLAFQTTKIWCPPTIPTVLIAASGLFVRLFGRRQTE